MVDLDTSLNKGGKTREQSWHRLQLTYWSFFVAISPGSCCNAKLTLPSTSHTVEQFGIKLWASILAISCIHAFVIE